MNTEKNISTRIIHKHDTEANWNKATNFIPKQGELIVYDKDQNHSQIRLKMGDGTTKVNDLPFSIDEILIGTTEEITPTQVKEAIEAGQNLLISHTDSAWGGEMKFSSFVYSPPFNTVLASGIFMYASEYYVAEIYGSLTYNTWNSVSTKLAQYDNIPTKTSHLENDSDFATEDKLPKALQVVIFDNGDGTGTSNKTYEEILAAYKNGSTILGRIDKEVTSVTLAPIMYLADGMFGATGIDSDGSLWAAIVTKDEGTLVGNSPLIQSPVIGTTAEITPSQVKELMDEGKSFAITHTDSTYGSMLFNSFVYSQAVNNQILSSTVFQVANVTFCAQLFGNLNNNTWTFSAFKLAKSEDIPTALKNPHALTINGTSYDGSEAKTISGLATETYVDGKVASMVDSAPETLNTLNELAAALGDDPNFATTIANQIGNKVDKVSGKGLSTNDYTTTEKNKLAGIAEGANKTIVDTTLDSTSTNPVQNKVVKEALDKKPGEIVAGKTYTIDDKSVTAATGAEIFNNSSNIASGAYSHAEGNLTEATGDHSHAEGYSTIASGACSHAEGRGGRALQKVNLTGAANATIYTYVNNNTTNFYPGDFFNVNGSRINIVAVDYTARKITVDSTLSATNITKQLFNKYRDCQASGLFSHVEGYNTSTLGESSHAEGESTIALGKSSHAEGFGTITSGESSHAEGNQTIASGKESHAEGNGTEAIGIDSHAEGYGAEAIGNYSHAEGLSTIAISDCSHVQGRNNIEDTEEKYAHIIGNGNRSTGKRSNAHTVDWQGNAWYAGDVYVHSTSGTNKDGGSTKLATEDQVKDALDKKPGERNPDNSSEIFNYYYNRAKGQYSHAEGWATEAHGTSAHAEGLETFAMGNYSHAEGHGMIFLTDREIHISGEANARQYQIIDEEISQRLGVYSIIKYDSVYAQVREIENNIITLSKTLSSEPLENATAYIVTNYGAIGENSHVEGYHTLANGAYSHAEGIETLALGHYSHTEGASTIAASSYQHVQGKNNIEDSEDKYVHIIGNGAASNNRSNAHTVDWQGNAWYAGDVYVHSTSGTNKDGGSTKLATVAQVNNKVDKVSGKGLSTNDYTTADKTKLDNTNIAYGTCSTAAATAEKVVVLNGNTQWSLKTGSIVMVKFDVSNSAENVKINVNNTGAYPIWYNNAEYTGTGTTYTGYANRTIAYMFNGTHYVWITASYDANSTYTNAALGQGYATCSTAAATTAKVGTLSSYKLVTGGIVSVAFTNAVPANATLNINSTGAKSIYFRGAKITGDVIKAGDVATFVYSTYYRLISIDRWQNDISTMQTQINNKLDTDDVNSLIDAKLAEIINAEEVAF